jgi:hypothetical protein
MKKAINELLLHVIKTIDNKKEITTMVKDVILPMMEKEQQTQVKKPEQVTKKKPEQVTKKKPEQIKEHTNSLVPPKSGNGHKIEKVDALEDWEKDLIRNEFIKLNGEILRDTCLEIKKKLSKDTAIFQVTGFVSLLHKYVLEGKLLLPSLEHYHHFQYLKKYGERDYDRQKSQSGKKKVNNTNSSPVISIVNNLEVQK